jgi:hypothetical protein
MLYNDTCSCAAGGIVRHAILRVLEDVGWLPYIVDLLSHDCHVFSLLRKALNWCRVMSDEDMKAVIMQWFWL